ncbi:lytic transglycosylase [Janthinobacterium sp. BJB304]|nr:lytic transglycosylase [Janthinobacterium sp. BJB304]
MVWRLRAPGGSTLSGLCLLLAMERHLSCFIAILVACPGSAWACWEQAAVRHHVPAPLLYAIAQAESSLDPNAVNRRHLRQTGTVDIGYMGVNSNPRVLRNLGVTEQELHEPCKNIHAGSRILVEKLQRYGNTWEAIGAYNASCTKLNAAQCQATRTRYAWRVYGFLTNTKPPAMRRATPQGKYRTQKNVRAESVVPTQPALVAVGLT